MTRGLLLLLLLAGCAAPTSGELLPESDAHATLDPERDLHIATAEGASVKITDLPGAEDAEARSPDGRWVAFVAGATGIASVWAVEISEAGPVGEPVQLTNVGLESVFRRPGEPPAGFVPPPDRASLRWKDDRTIVWTAAGVEHTVERPR
jgi:hypothetical protein